jgi:hypothetical protein
MNILRHQSKTVFFINIVAYRAMRPIQAGVVDRLDELGAKASVRVCRTQTKALSTNAHQSAQKVMKLTALSITVDRGESARPIALSAGEVYPAAAIIAREASRKASCVSPGGSCA